MTTKHVLVVQHLRPYSEGEHPHKGEDWYDFIEEPADDATKRGRLDHMQKHQPEKMRVVERVVCESVVWPNDKPTEPVGTK